MLQEVYNVHLILVSMITFQLTLTSAQWHNYPYLSGRYVRSAITYQTPFNLNSNQLKSPLVITNSAVGNANQEFIPKQSLFSTSAIASHSENSNGVGTVSGKPNTLSDGLSNFATISFNGNTVTVSSSNVNPAVPSSGNANTLASSSTYSNTDSAYSGGVNFVAASSSSANTVAGSPGITTASASFRNFLPLNAVPNEFTRASLAIPSLQKFLNLLIPGYQAAELIFKTGNDKLIDLGHPLHDAIAKTASHNAVGLGDFTIPLHLYIRGNVIEKFLESEGFQNVPNLPQIYANHIEKALESQPISSTETLFKALLEGYSKFLLSLGFDFSEKSSILATNYNNEISQFIKF